MVPQFTIQTGGIRRTTKTSLTLQWHRLWLTTVRCHISVHTGWTALSVSCLVFGRSKVSVCRTINNLEAVEPQSSPQSAELDWKAQWSNRHSARWKTHHTYSWLIKEVFHAWLLVYHSSSLKLFRDRKSTFQEYLKRSRCHCWVWCLETPVRTTNIQYPCSFLICLNSTTRTCN